MNKKRPSGVDIVFASSCSFCGEEFKEGDKAVIAFGWDMLEHPECAGMALAQLNSTLAEIAEIEESK